MRRNTLLRLRNLWYLVDLLDQVSRDIVLEPRTICMLVACQYEDSESCKIYISSTMKMAAGLGEVRGLSAPSLHPNSDCTNWSDNRQQAGPLSGRERWRASRRVTMNWHDTLTHCVTTISNHNNVIFQEKLVNKELSSLKSILGHKAPTFSLSVGAISGNGNLVTVCIPHYRTKPIV